MKNKEKIELRLTIRNDGGIEVHAEAFNFVGPSCKQAIDKVLGSLVQHAENVKRKNKKEYYKKGTVHVQAGQTQKLYDM